MSNLIGTGLTPRWQIDDKARKKDLHDLWADWIQESDADGMLDFYGQQALAVRATAGFRPAGRFRASPRGGFTEQRRDYQ